MAKFSINLKDGSLDKSAEEELIVGIDLGTTNSLVAYVHDGQPRAVKGADGKSTLVPSIVHFADDGGVLVGEAAKARLRQAPERTIYSVKRLMGKSYRDVAAVEQFFGYKIIDEDSESLVKVRVGERFYSPIELSAHILRELKQRIEGQVGRSISKAVITVPAYFNDAQRQATRDAGKLAGLEVLRIVNEPTAASLAYGLGQSAAEGQTIAVYDLGGGTFDVSVLRIENGIFEVLATNGDTFLGGDDFDRAILDYWENSGQIEAQRLREDKTYGQSLRLLAEAAKKQLSAVPLFEGNIEGRPVQISREAFEAAIQPLIERTLAACRQALRDAQLQAADIQHVLLVGGSTRTPAVKAAVAAFFGRPANDSLDPDEVVALGAAVQADILAGKQRGMLLLDVTPLSLGIETVGGLMDTIIPRNSKVPSRVGRQYTTSVDGQKNLKVAVYQGERDLVAHNRKLGEFILRGIPPMPAGLPKIEIHFILDADGILQVRAKELRSGVEQTVEIRSQYGIGEEDMARMLLDSIQHAQEDMATRALLEARNEANTILLAADKFLQQNAALLSAEETARIGTLREALAAEVQAGSKDAIQAAMDALNEYTKPLAHRALDVHIAEAMRGRKL